MTPAKGMTIDPERLFQRLAKLEHRIMELEDETKRLRKIVERLDEAAKEP